MALKSARPVHVSPWIAVPLSVLMILVASLTFTGMPRGDGPEWPVLTTIRDKRTLLNIGNDRMLRTPLWLYQGGKGITSMLWCILIPLQHSSTVRSRWLQLHRMSGYITVLLSIELGLAGYYMMSQDMVTSHDNFFHVHKLYGIPFPPFVWPTFNFSTCFLGIFYFSSLYKLVTTVRDKQIESHRRWAVFHSMCGYAIPIERVFTVVVGIIGGVVQHLPRNIQDDWLNVPRDIEGKVEVEMSALAWTLIASFYTVVFWMHKEFSNVGPVGLRDAIETEEKKIK